MSIVVLILGIVLLFCALNPFWLIVAIANFLVAEVYRRKEDKKLILWQQYCQSYILHDLLSIITFYKNRIIILFFLFIFSSRS